MKYFVAIMLVMSLCSTKQALADHEQILVAIDHAPPYSALDDKGNARGLILDILNYIKHHSDEDIAVKAVPCPFSRCIRMLAQGEVDVMGGLIRTPDRERQMAFVTPPYMALSSSFVFYSHQHSQIEVRRYEDLIGKRIAVMRGAAFFPRFDQDSRLDKVEVPSERTAVDLVLKGRVDLVIAVEDTADLAMNVLAQPAHQLRKMDYRHTQVIYGHMAMSRAFAQSHVGREFTEHMQRMAKNKILDKLVAPYQLPAIPPQLLSEETGSTPKNTF
ncbi:MULTISPECIES: transporter substrate-binding domain-containing protein [Pseudoalteromonas]|uniref:Transporter substrate-binding domain-containing protein n=1 Tax=Pseudoalteromonas rubra TaxID=43658 RepID=A0A5S3V1G6_9GAMM|nr:MULTISPECIES: transporter substrate-binding domain-containing protein [Pseudoalteromonas]MCG7563882.1 transporter substrate-binding domain-containing protein [Pseudoalteromonas sp. McH1-42]MEC4091485.1 transporter substrate-binding domain-containing protein [Pseudoalteromonas rubra]QPB84873.1 transporter substrate-binding domain-containing protein [Pseudoalteromonas rubra]